MVWPTLDFKHGPLQCNHHSTSAKPEKVESQKKLLNMPIPDHDIPQAVLCSVKSQEIELDMPQKFHKALESVVNEMNPLA